MMVRVSLVPLRTRDRSSHAVLATVVPVLDEVVAAVHQSARDLGPGLAHGVDEVENEPGFVVAHGARVQFRSQVLVVSLSALLRGTSPDRSGDLHPVLGLEMPPANEVHETVVLIRLPQSLARVLIFDCGHFGHYGENIRC